MTKFTSLLAQAPRSTAPFGYKDAQSSGIESADEQQMEQDFAKLAYMFVQDRAAPLMKYMLGFEVVNREEDGSKAIGIFGFKIGKDYYYVPSFFMNNQIKGVDMLFCKRTNSFVPLQEDWINYVVNRQTIQLGSGADGSKVNKDFENPDFSFLSQPPSGPGSKSASDDTPWTFKEAWRQMHDQLADMLEKDAEFQQAWTGWVCACKGLDVPVEKTASSPLLNFIESSSSSQASTASTTSGCCSTPTPGRGAGPMPRSASPCSRARSWP